MAHPPKEKMLRILRMVQTQNEGVAKMVNIVYEERLSKDSGLGPVCLEY